MKKRIFIGTVTIICIVLTIYLILSTYAIFESNVTGEIEVQKAKWIIHINNTDITNNTNKNFVIDNVEIQNSDRVEDGNIAPGLNGKFNIVIDPKDTDVSVRYDITFDLSSIEDTKIRINSIDEIEVGNTFIKTGENTYTGVISLDEIKQGIINDIQVEFSWEEDETTKKKDTEIGSIPDNKISIPVSIKVTQYLGEEIEEYN